ncbi:GTA-gp10 family protein [Qipengyuania sp.]|uniref:GTA-gp10 family protein n=1 Tax=Qipengyuania sp. TaxID=2004515 RepID=UPI0035C8350A
MATAPKAAARKRRAPRSAANANRGENTLVLGGTAYVLRPSYAAITTIEEQLGRSSIELLRAANGMALSYEDQGVIVAELVRAGAAKDDEFTRNVSAERMGELIFEEGSAPAFVAITVALASAVGGGRTAAGEAKPVTKA